MTTAPRLFGHMVVLGTPYDERRWLVSAQIAPMLGKPGAVFLQSSDQVDGDFPAFGGHEGPMQLPKIRQDAAGQL